MAKAILIAGGGTGGHIYPAVAIAQALKKSHPDLEVEFVGTTKGLEAKIVPKEGFRLHFISSGALKSVGRLRQVLSLISFVVGVIQSIFLLKKLDPSVVLGVGGYASGPMMIAALLMRKKTAIFESNAYPGLTNRFLARLVNLAFVNFDVSEKFFRSSLPVGMPVRAGLLPQPRLSHDMLRILIFGGSQGARGINTAVLEALKKGGPWLSQVGIVHQIGSRDFSSVDKEYKNLTLPQLQWFEFIYDMPKYYMWADVVFCRAGSSTLAELAACRKAAVLIPFPFASDNHQQSNAEAIVHKEGAVMVLQKDFTAEKFIGLVNRFLTHRNELEGYERKVGSFYKPRAAEAIAEKLLELGS